MLITTLYDYEESSRIAMLRSSFYGVLMAAMRQADTENGEILASAFPQVWAELYARYNAPGGTIPGDEEPRRIVVTNITNEDH
jgi:hypothetical protein